MNKSALAICLFWFAAALPAAELSGVYVDDEIATAEGQSLVLNGIGLREKLWVDVYVGSLYLPGKTSDVAEILSAPGPWRVQLDFVYKEVSRDKLLEAWREGFEQNQSAENLARLTERIDRFYAFFATSAVAKDRYSFDYTPGQGVRVSRNGNLLGIIEGEDFKTALLEIWLGNKPADKGLKKGMLGL
jgi:hypothetical protein